MTFARSVKRLVGTWLIAGASLGIGLAHAADSIAPEHRAAAKEAAIAVGATRQIELVLSLMLNQMERTYGQLNPDLSQELSAVFDALRPKFSATMNVHIDKLADEYASKFTVEELQTIAAFYTSAAGRKFVNQERALEKSSARIGREFSEQLSKEIDAMVRAEMKKRGHNL